MNPRTIRLLVAKDLALVRGPFALYTALAATAAVIVAVSHGHVMSSIAATLAINVLVGTAFHVMLGPVLGERERRTLAFVMALPVSPREVGLAKVLSAYALFLVPGAIATVALAWLSPSVAVGYYPVVLGAWIVLFTVVLATAVVTESMGRTIGMLLLLLFVVGNFAMQVAPRLPWVWRIARIGAAHGWLVPAAAAIEAALVAATIALMLALQRRKTSFV